MKVIEQSHKIKTQLDYPAILELIEGSYRLCYQSDKGFFNQAEAEKFIKAKISPDMKIRHESPIEHFHITVDFVTSRDITHEIVRHRLSNYSQESTRYNDYSREKFGKQIAVILPDWCDRKFVDFKINSQQATDEIVCQLLNIVSYSNPEFDWLMGCIESEIRYLNMVHKGSRPEQARSVLTGSTKTTLRMTCNIREWKWVFNLRCSKGAHPQMRALMLPLLKEFYEKMPVFFETEYREYCAEILGREPEISEWAERVHASTSKNVIPCEPECQCVECRRAKPTVADFGLEK